MKLLTLCLSLSLVACGEQESPVAPTHVIVPAPNVTINVLLPDGHVCDRTCPPSHPTPKPPTPAVPDRCLGKAGDDFKARDHVQFINECGSSEDKAPNPPAPVPPKPVPPSCRLAKGC